MLRRNGTGSTASASRPMATATPLMMTAFPACSMASTTDSRLSFPPACSSRQRITISRA